jgi:putative flippase GtrA
MIVIASALLSRHAQIVRFLLSGGTATVTNLSVAFLLTDIFRVYYLLSSALAFVASFAVSFMLQKFWTFKNYSVDMVNKQVVLAFLVAGGNLVLNTIIVFCFVEYFAGHYLLGQFVASGVIATETFFLYKYHIFVSVS